jgi:hypothetical protein
MTEDHVKLVHSLITYRCAKVPESTCNVVKGTLRFLIFFF